MKRLGGVLRNSNARLQGERRRELHAKGSSVTRRSQKQSLAKAQRRKGNSKPDFLVPPEGTQGSSSTLGLLACTRRERRRELHAKRNEYLILYFLCVFAPLRG